MKHLKKFENDNLDITEIVKKDEIYEIFDKYNLTCDPQQNRALNSIEYDIDNLIIICNFSVYTYDGKVPTNIIDILTKIANEIHASDYVFGNYSRGGSYQVKFKYTEEQLEDIEIKKSSKKYNI